MHEWVFQRLSKLHESEAVADTSWNIGGARAEGTRILGVSGGMPPRKIFEIWAPEIAFAAFWEHIL
jgi:hypothetical protein